PPRRTSAEDGRRGADRPVQRSLQRRSGAGGVARSGHCSAGPARSPPPARHPSCGPPSRRAGSNPLAHGDSPPSCAPSALPAHPARRALGESWASLHSSRLGTSSSPILSSLKDRSTKTTVTLTEMRPEQERYQQPARSVRCASTTPLSTSVDSDRLP